MVLSDDFVSRFDVAGEGETRVVSLPEREMLAWENPQLAEQVRAAVADAEAGRSVDLGDFTQYTDADTDGGQGTAATLRKVRKGPGLL